MLTGRPKAFEITLNDIERKQLQDVSSSRSLPNSLVRRAKIILLSAGGKTNTEIAKRFKVRLRMVGHWRNQFNEHGLGGLYGALRLGRPRVHGDPLVAELIAQTLTSGTKGKRQWSERAIARRSRISKSTVHRYFRFFGLESQRQNTFKLSNDLLFLQKLCDIVGLYLNPPDKAIVLCANNTDIRNEFNRIQHSASSIHGYPEGVNWAKKRDKSTTMFVALSEATGRVITRRKLRNRNVEFLAFLVNLDRSVPNHIDVYLILDHYDINRHPPIRDWLAVRPRFHVRKTDTYFSWLDHVERWIALVYPQSISHEPLGSVRKLVRDIDIYVRHYRSAVQPFIWTIKKNFILSRLQ